MVRMAKFDEIYSLLKSKIPKEDSYHNETYGDDNCEGLEEVRKILYCVTPSREIDEYFKENNYDLLICHHIGSSSVPNLTFHTALDFCEGGLTDYWSKLVGIKNPLPIQKNAGAYGEINPISFKDLVDKIDKEVDGIIGQCIAKNDVIRTIAVCSGYGAIIQKAVEKLDVDCYVLGQTYSKFKDTELNGIIEVGHTKSERIGVYSIRNILKDYQDIVVDVAPLDIDTYGSEVSVRREDSESNN